MSDVPSEKTQAKAAEYLLSGRVKVKDCREIIEFPYGTFVAHVMSASQAPGDPYIVRFNANGWHCDCPARVQVCAHILACQTITEFKIPEKPAEPVFERNPDIDRILGNL